MSETGTEQLNTFLDDIFETLQMIQSSYTKLNAAFGELLLESPQIGNRWLEHRQELLDQKFEEKRVQREEQSEVEQKQEEQMREPERKMEHERQRGKVRC